MSLWREYAADPAVFCRTWAECNHVLDDIGWYKGRVIAEFPHRAWRKLFYESLQQSKETEIRKQRIVERFRQFVGFTRQERVRNGLIPCSRGYTSKNTWLESAVATHTVEPFDAIVALENPSRHGDVLQVDDLDERHPLWAVGTSRTIDRSIRTLKECIGLFARLSHRLIVIDPYFDATDGEKLVAVEAYLELMSAEKTDPCILVLHYARENDKIFDGKSHVKYAKAQLGGMIRSGQCVECFVWRKPPIGSPDIERFHDRFLISELGGLGIQGGAGVSSEAQHTSVYFLSHDECQFWPGLFNPSAPTFELLCNFNIS